MGKVHFERLRSEESQAVTTRGEISVYTISCNRIGEPRVVCARHMSIFKCATETGRLTNWTSFARTKCTLRHPRTVMARKKLNVRVKTRNHRHIPNMFYD